ncbi:MAG: hypothetical protein ACYCT9_05030 [Leptospirillum sp.]|jgi:hypothetical protein
MSILAWIAASIISAATITPVITKTVAGVSGIIDNSCANARDQAAFQNYPNVHSVSCVDSQGKEKIIFLK